MPEHVLLALLEAVPETGAATVALPVADTLVRQSAAGDWGELTPREGLWAVQTPQGFDRAALLDAHRQAARDGFAATDDAGLLARLGVRVRLVPGDARLFKVTTPGDLALAQALARTLGRSMTRFFAPAKINLGLSVLGVRENGYHDLHSLMVPLTVGDELEIRPAEALTLRVEGADLPTDERNLVYRAARAYLDAAGVTGGADIVLHKRLPLASGLGGGSSDAASTLLALAELYPSDVDLPALALSLGADVPFFLLGGAALAQGVGERLTPHSRPAARAFGSGKRGRGNQRGRRLPLAGRDGRFQLSPKAGRDSAGAGQRRRSALFQLAASGRTGALSQCPDHAGGAGRRGPTFGADVGFGCDLLRAGAGRGAGTGCSRGAGGAVSAVVGEGGAG